MAFILAFRYLKILQLKNMPLWIMPSAFGLKVFVGIIFLIMYLHPNEHNSVPSDTMRFLSESKQLHDVFRKSPSDYFTLLSGIGDDKELIHKYLSHTFLWDSGSLTIVNDSRNIIRVHSLIQFISFGSPFIHTLFMCFIAMIGMKNLFISIQPYTRIRPTVLFFILLLFPSMLFWTSGILKEPFLFLGIGLFARSLLSEDNLKKKVIFCIFGSALLFMVKPYVIACLIPSIGFYLLYQHLFKQRLVLSLLAFFIIGIGSICLFWNKSEKTVNYLSMKQFDFNHIGKGGLYVRSDTCLYYFEPKQYNKLKINKKEKFVELIHPTYSTIVTKRNLHPRIIYNIKPSGIKWGIQYDVKGAQSYIKTTPINNSMLQLIKNIPEALINSYCRPFINDPGSALRYLAMFEVWALTSFLVFSIYKRRKIDKQTLGIIISLLLFSIFLLLVIGWTTPVIGAIFRYRFPAQLALLLIGAILLEKHNKTISHE